MPRELTAVVHGDALGPLLLRSPSVLCDFHSHHRTIRCQPDAFPREMIDYGDNAERTPIR